MKQKFSIESLLGSIKETKEQIATLKRLPKKASLDREIELRRRIKGDIVEQMDSHNKEIEAAGINYLRLEGDVTNLLIDACGLGNDQECLDHLCRKLDRNPKKKDLLTKKFKFDLTYSQIIALADAVNHALERGFDGESQDAATTELSLRAFFAELQGKVKELSPANRKLVKEALKQSSEICSDL